MDELVQDLVSALDDSSLKKEEIDDQGDMSATSTKIDRELYRKRRTRKRRTASTSSHLVSSFLNNLAVVNQIHSPRSSSSLDEAVKDYVESFTANCSDESDSYANAWNNKLKNAVLSSGLQDRVHHKRVFKQATPCCCESDSHTENGLTIPVLRKQRRKKLKRMTVDGEPVGSLRDSQGPTSGSCDENQRRKQPSKTTPHPSAEGSETDKMCCKTTKLKKERKNAITCLICYQKSCDKLQQNRNSAKHVLPIRPIGDDMRNDKTNLKDEEIPSCECNCHTNQGKDESSISSTSSNSDTDSANFTQDDMGGDGDDEMTDFYAESDGGPVWGIPNICGMRWLARNQDMRNSKDEALWSHKVEDSSMLGNPYVYDAKMKRFVAGSMHLSDSFRRGFHARHNRLPGMAARSIRRGRRRVKMKKVKEKREQDFHSSLSKLSLSERSKRIKLDGMKDAFCNRPDWSSRRLIPSFPISQPLATKGFEIGMNDTANNHNKDTLNSESAARTSSTFNGSR